MLRIFNMSPSEVSSELCTYFDQLGLERASGFRVKNCTERRMLRRAEGSKQGAPSRESGGATLI